MQNDDDKGKQPPRIDQSVTSHNQSGGITAHTVNLRAPARDINAPGMARIRAELLEKLPRHEPVKIMAVASDLEAHGFANQIAAFLRANGYEIAEMGSLMSAPPPPPGVSLAPMGLIIGSRE